MADGCYSECLDGNVGKAGVWNRRFYKHPKWHKDGSGHSHSGMSEILCWVPLMDSELFGIFVSKCFQTNLSFTPFIHSFFSLAFMSFL